MKLAAVDDVIDIVLADVPGSERIDPHALIFLLRCYRLIDRPDLREALEPALARALEQQAVARTIGERDARSASLTGERSAWLIVFADAMTRSSVESVIA